MYDDLGCASPAQRAVTHDPSHHGDGVAAGGPLVGPHGHLRGSRLRRLWRRLWGGALDWFFNAKLGDRIADIDEHTRAAAGRDPGDDDAGADRDQKADANVRPGVATNVPGDRRGDRVRELLHVPGVTNAGTDANAGPGSDAGGMPPDAGPRSVVRVRPGYAPVGGYVRAESPDG